MMQKSINEAGIKMPRQKYVSSEIRDNHVKAWRKSNLSKTAYSQQNGITLSNLSKWVQRDKILAQPSFKRVIPSALGSVRPSGVIEILVDARLKIRLPETMGPQLIASIVKELIKCN